MNFSKIKNSPFWMHFFAFTSFVIVLFLFFQVGVSVYTRHGQGIIVPDVKGLLYSEAEYQLHNLELEALVVDSDYVKDLPAGSIVEQSPVGGLKVKRNRTIYLTVNANSSPTLALPDLADNSSKRQAMVRLQSMGFKIGAIETIDGEKDWVYAIKYRGRKVFSGDRVPSEATLTLVVGSGLFAGDTDSTLTFTMDDIGSYSEELSSDDRSSTETNTKPDEWF